MKVVKEYMLVINSANRNSGTTSNFTIDVPHEVNISVDKEHHQILKITLLKFSSYLEFYNITAGETDTITFKKLDSNDNVVQTLTAVIPQGNYTYAQLASSLSNPICTVTYVPRLNKFLFNFNNYKGSLTFFNKSHRAFGFTSVNTVTSTVEGSNNVIYSQNALKPRPFDKLNIYLNNVVVIAENFENNLVKTRENETLPGKYLAKSRLLASVELNNPPFTLLTYDGALDNYGLFVDDKRLKRLSFNITNEYNEEFTGMKEAQMILKLELMEDDSKTENEILEQLKTINEYMRLFFLSSNIK